MSMRGVCKFCYLPQFFPLLYYTFVTFDILVIFIPTYVFETILNGNVPMKSFSARLSLVHKMLLLFQDYLLY